MSLKGSIETDQDIVLDIRSLKTQFFLEKGTVKAVDGVDLKIRRNTTLGLVGESGCGKSVTSLSVMRLIQGPVGKITGGQILFKNRKKNEITDLVTLDPRGPEMRAIRGGEIGMVFQEPMTSLNPLYTVGKQIGETVRLHENAGKKEARERALEMLKKVHVSAPEQRLDEYPHQLSGGMRQRVMIAMALSCNPSVLIADEPTTALDVTIQAQILDLMRELQQDYNSAIVMVTHNLGVVSQMADHVAVMYLGRIVEYGSVEKIFHEPLHPYTQGLLKSVPVFGRKSRQKLVPIEGMVPTPTGDIPVCAFRPRCPVTKDYCKNTAPELNEVLPDHYVGCWYAEKTAAG